jgi:pSer/pThr/pTyr-binding forkhead associated (FHA) protein
MVQLSLLSGPMAGETKIARRFPFHVGRSQENDLSLNDAGIWNYHFMLDLRKSEGFVVQTFDEAYATVNDQPQTSAKPTRLRNGDIIAFGAAKIQFWLAPALQRNQRIREAFIWALVAGVTASQVTLIVWLLGIK